MKERLSRFRSFWLFPVLALLLLYATARMEPARNLSNLLWLLPIGLLTWTLLEYALHRFAFHMQTPIRNPRLRGIVNGSHLGHHAAPRDPTIVLVHPLYGLVISAALYACLYAVTWSLFVSAGVLTGIWAGFLYYEAVHYRVHFSLSGSGLLAWQRRAHFYHHFTNNRRCFGVTSPIWDYVFGTRRGSRGHWTEPLD
jgi:sterol desaturase/sphingolipid hydroxylase (fatty acid hydroxylase superfamily)